MAAPDLSGETLGGFVLTERIGAGAFASVYLARQIRLDRDVAIKVLDPTLARDPDTARRFEREGRAAASLDHPAIVPVYEAGETDGVVWLAMRLVDGETLDDRLERDGPLSIADTATVLRPVAEALDHAHARDLVHRDVKPSNILVDDDRVFLADFGIAASAREIGRYTTGAIGTANYMAPEQAAGGDIDERADLYALGCVAFRCLLGRAPFEQADLVSTLVAHVNDPIPPTGDADLDEFFATALAKDPGARFTSATALVDALATVEAASAGQRPTAAAATALTAAATVDGFTVPRQPDPTLDGAPAATPRRRGVAVWVAIVGVIALAAGILAGIATSNDGGSTQADGASTTVPETTATTVAPAPVPATPAFDRNRTATIGIDLIFRVLSPYNTFTGEWMMTRHVVPPLMDVGPDYTLTPWLAADEPTVVSTEPFVVEWRLRDDAVWDDGTPITANDVRATYDYILDPESDAAAKALYSFISEFEIVDDHTFRLTLSEPMASHRVLFSTQNPIIKAAAIDDFRTQTGSRGGFWAEYADDERYRFSGGPYRLAGLVEGQAEFRRNDSFWGESEAPLATVIVKFIGNADDGAQSLADGDIDVLYAVAPAVGDKTRLASIDGVTVDAGEAHVVDRLHFNTKDPVLSDVRVRQAIAKVIPRQDYVRATLRTIGSDTAEPLASVIWSDGQADYDPDGPFATYGNPTDIAGAAALLADAGFTKPTDKRFFERDGAPLSLTFLYIADSNQNALTTSMFRALVDFGIDITLQGYVTAEELENFYIARREGQFDLLWDDRAVNVDPIGANFEFESDRCPRPIPGCTADFGNNWTGVSDPELDSLLDAALAETDPEVRVALLRDADERLAELMPSLPLVRRPALVAYRDGIVGLDPDAYRGGPVTNFDRWGFGED